MKKINDSYFSTEEYEFKPFSEDDLAMVLGGGGDEQILDFFTKDGSSDDSDDALS
jgi:hypothetical protein